MLARHRLLHSTVLTAAILGGITPAHAFCGFYVSGSSDKLLNNATQVALMRFGTRTVLSMQNNYQGPPQNFAMVVPVPVVLHKENVKTLPLDVFDHLEKLTSPRLVEYWEKDPCAVEVAVPTTTATGGVGPGGGPPGMTRHMGSVVRIEAQFAVGEYEVVILSATESTGLETWLHDNHYNIPQGAAEYLAQYVREQSKFFVARVDISKVKKNADGSASLSPLRFNYDSPEFRLPVRLGLLNAPEAQDLIVYVLHPTSRFDVANYPNVFIPTNLDVADSVKNDFAGFYTTLFDRTLAHAGGRAVVTEYAWSVGGCDPCPGPPMSDQETATLGGDVVYTNNPAPQTYHGRAFDYVVTRLHTRYSKATLTEDLVFKEAPNVMGGREFVVNENREVEHGAITANAYMNNFQARYAIRHAWTGEIQCAAPIRNRWQGPPSGTPSAPVQPAQGLANAKRGDVDLLSVVYTAAPEIGLAAAKRANAPLVDAGRVVVSVLDAGSTASKPTTPPAPAPEGKKNCGCSTPGESSGSGLSAMFTALMVAMGLTRLRRKSLRNGS